ncbi:hypothetical protein [Nonomuraea sp. NPDC001699]
MSGAYATRSRLSPSAVARPSAIHGTGLFAVRPISRDEPVMRLGGQVIDDDALASLPPPYNSLTVGEGVHLLLDPDHPVRFGNHSCDPTLWHLDATTVAARRDGRCPAGAARTCAANA